MRGMPTLTFSLQYLEDLECPYELDAASTASDQILDWLLHYAVDLAYTDSGILLDRTFLLKQLHIQSFAAEHYLNGMCPSQTTRPD